jgi:uncharacterized protein (DUF1697 family)
MTRYVALLRGINVGGRNKVAMPALRACCESLGHNRVVTYIQSGNVVFDAAKGTPARLARGLSDALDAMLGLRIDVVVRSAAELQRVTTTNPFPTEGVDPTTLHVLFLASTPTAAAVEVLAATHFPPNEYVVRGDDVFLRAPDGIGRTRLPNFDKVLGTVATGRNWRTVLTLAEMAGVTVR